MKTKIITLIVLIIFAAVHAAALNMDALKDLKKQKTKSGEKTVIKYKSKNSPQKNFKAGSEMRDYDNTMFYLYIGVRDKNEAFLRMHVQLEPAVDWINFTKIIVTADDVTFEREFSKERLHTTVALRAQYLEFYDEEVMPHEIQIFEKISTAEEVTIQFIGEKSQQELKLKDKRIEAIKDIIDAWKKLNS